MSSQQPSSLRDGGGGAAAAVADRAPEPAAPERGARRNRLASSEARGLVVPLVGLVALVAFFGVSADNFLTVDNLYSVLRDAAVLLIVSIGMTWVILMGSIDLSVGAILTLSGMVTAITLDNDYGILASIGFGLAVGLGAGVVNGLLFAVAKVPSFLVTLGTSLALTGIALWSVGGRSVQVFDPSFSELSTSTVIADLPNIALWSLVIYGVAILIGQRTRFGRFTFAIGGGEQVARLSGVTVQRYKFYALVVSGLLAGLAGILLTARVGAATPTMGDTLALQTIAAVVMGGTALTGGVGGVHRTLLGVLVITILANGMDTMAVNPYLQSIIQGAVVILAVALTLDRSKISVLK
jgi:ribose transport system permease protein/putative xylitol transport system permease protein